ncbi:hypothetical protein [Nocardioides sp.]|uniref:hypothetical protein n=1 Tax=Nocardioides sp. TaxID=35761 RepID=UPI003D0AC95A
MNGTPEDRPSDSTATETAAAPGFHEAYQAKLGETIRALSDAARLPRPRLRRTDEGTWVEDTEAAPEQMDWAEFVTLAIAGVAANMGGIDAVLAGRSGSWEAEGVRQLLYSTVGADEAQLWAHRTDPVDITLYVDELLVDRTEAWAAYDQAQTEINRSYDVASRDWSEDLDARYMWVYDRTDAGAMVARDPDAPAWSWDAWRTGLDPETPQDFREAVEESLRTGTGLFTGRPDGSTAHIPKSEEDRAEHQRLLDAHEARLTAIGELEERLEEQRLQEWAAYGQALKARVEALAAATPGLDVPVQVHVDVDTFRRDSGQREGFWNSLEARLVDAAVMDTPTPEDLPGTPLERLTRALETDNAAEADN